MHIVKHLPPLLLRNIQLYSSTNGGDASHIGMLLSNRLFVGYSNFVKASPNQIDVTL